MNPTLFLHKFPLYNTGRLDDAGIIAAFAARGPLFERIIADLATEKDGSRAQHHLIVGQRGMGKTMLLSRIAAEIRTSGLGQHLMPLVFAEEQYAVDRLSKFWLNCLDSLADARDRAGHAAEAAEIDGIVHKLASNINARAKDDDLFANEVLAEFLGAAASFHLRPVLLVDNLQLVFERISEPQQHALREILMRPGCPILIGTCPSPPPETQSYGAAFYDHFKVHYLRPLEVDEMKDLMLHLAEAMGRDDVRARILGHPHRLEVLRQLTGGNPRTTATLFFLYAEDFAPSVFGDLENLLDRVTPLYKARIEELSAQQQVITSAIANHWDPVTSRTLSDTIGIPMTGVSPQLDRLEKTGFIERVSLFGQASTGYQIAERFFNIWFLMRSASRRQRKEVEFLTRFIENFYEVQDRSKLAGQLLRECDFSPDRHLFIKALAATLDDQVAAADLERHSALDALRQKAAESRRKLNEILDLSALPPATLAFNELRERLVSLVQDDACVSPTEFAETILGDRQMFMSRDRERLASAVGPLSYEEIANLVEVARDHQMLDEKNYGAEPTRFLSQRLANGQIRALKDVEDWNRAILLCQDNPTMRIVLETLPDSYGKLLSNEAMQRADAALKTRGNGDAAFGIYRIAILLQKFDRSEEALVMYREHLHNLEEITQSAKDIHELNLVSERSENAILADKVESVITACDGLASAAGTGIAIVKSLVGLILVAKLDRPEEGENVLKEAVSVCPDSAFLWMELGDLYSTALNRPADAKAAYAKALELDPDMKGCSASGMFCYYRDVLADLATARDLLNRLKAKPASPSAGWVTLQEGVFSAYERNWGLATAALSQALDWELDDFEVTPQDEWMRASAVLVHLGFGGEFLSLLEQRGDHVRLRPWYEALKALHLNEKGHLTNIAPEIRTTAELLFDAMKRHLDKLPVATCRCPAPATKTARARKRDSGHR